MNSMLGFVKRVFSLHTRSLSWLRIGLGLLLLFDLIRRTIYFDAIMLDTGTMPFAIVYDNHSNAAFWSLYMFIKAQRWTILMFVIHWIVVLCFIAGRKTKEMSILVRIFTASLYGRNPMVINGGDTLMRVMLFWCMFLPVGEHWSVDAKHQTGFRQGNVGTSFWNIASIGFIIQLLSVYIFTFLLKTDPIRTKEFTATYYALSLDAFRTTLGDQLYTMPGVMKGLTAGSYILEGYAAILLFVPWRNAMWRKITIGIFIAFHLGLASMMHIGPFPFIAIMCWLALWPHSKTQPIRQGNTNRLLNLLLIGVITLTTCWNIRTLDFDRHEKRFPRTVNQLVFTLRMEQSWAMFAPYPFKDDGRFLFTGIDEEGNEHDINTSLPGIKYNHQGAPRREYTSEMRNKYYSNMRKKKYSYLRMPFLEYACTKLDYNRIIMEFKRETTKPDYASKPGEIVRLASHTCE